MDERPGPSNARERQALLNRLRRLEGQVRGIAGMVERRERDADILQQVAALRAAIDALGLLVVEANVRDRVSDAVERGDAEAATDEVVDLIRRSMGRPARGSAPRGGAAS